MIFLGGTSGFHYGQVILQIHLSVGQVDFLTKFDPCCVYTYLDLGPPVPLGASGDEKPPPITVTGDPAGSMPADTHLF